MRESRRQYERTLTTPGAIVLSGVPLLTFAVILAYKRYFSKDDNLQALEREINGKTIYKELDENFSPKIETIESKLEEIFDQLNHSITRITEEVTEVRTKQELATTDETARKIGHDNMHARINDLLNNTNRIAKCQDRNMNKLHEQSQRIEELERSFHELEEGKGNLASDFSKMPTLSNSLSEFKAAMMGEVEDYLRAEIAKLSRTVKNDITYMKEENFTLNESAVAQEQYVSQELQDMQSLMNDMEKRIKNQMFDMETRLRSRNPTPEGSQRTSKNTSPRDLNATFSPEEPQSNGLITIFSSTASCPSTPLTTVAKVKTQKTPSLADELSERVEEAKEARKSFPSKIKPPAGVQLNRSSVHEDSGDAAMHLKPPRNSHAKTTLCIENWMEDQQ